ncbi:MAG: fibronectin type III domain-containing protein, partial [Planctomycetes bacterium]|nr:fibronectin type III domain-containing protein [Planctomycetota bacterium]
MMLGATGCAGWWLVGGLAASGIYVSSSANDDEDDPPPSYAPPAPSSLTVNPFSPNRINLDWTDNSGNENGFEIERGSNNITFTRISTTGPGITAFSDSTLTENTTCYYRVRAYHITIGDSAYSNIASTTTFLNTPTGLTTTVLSPYTIKLDWDNNSSAEDGYKIERKAGISQFIEIATVITDVVTYTNLPVTASTTFTYRIKAYNSSVESAYSSEITA